MTLSEMSLDSDKNECIYVQKSVSDQDVLTDVSETEGRLSTNVSDKGVQTDTPELVNVIANKSHHHYYTNVSTNLSEYAINGSRWADREKTRY